MNPTSLYILLVAFVATLVRSTFGFGEALFAVPLLALRIPLAVATPLAVLISITVAAVVVVQDHKRVHFRSAGWLLLASLFGIPLGLLLLASGHERLLKGTLAGIILAFTTYSLWGRRPPHLPDEHRAWLLLCGFFAGILGGAFGTNGPPLVMYGTMRRWPPQQFRATLQGYFLPASILGMAGYAAAGLWTRAVTHDYLLSLIGILPAIFIGRFINRRLHGDAFLRFAYASLAIVGVALVVQAFRP